MHELQFIRMENAGAGADAHISPYSGFTIDNSQFEPFCIPACRGNLGIDICLFLCYNLSEVNDTAHTESVRT